MTIKDSQLTMTITQEMVNNHYPYCLPYGMAVVTLDLDTGGATDVAGSELAVTPPTDAAGNPLGTITYMTLPGSQGGYSFSPGSNAILVTADSFSWPPTCQVTVKLNPTDTQYLSTGSNIHGIAEYIPYGGNIQGTINYFLTVAKMTITGQKNEDGSYPGIKPGETGTVTLEVDTQGSLDATGAKLVIAAPAGTTITGVNLPSAAAGTWTQTLSDNGSSATVTLTADGILWSSCEVTLQVNDSTYGGITEASAEYYHTGSESTTPDATGQYGIVVQAVNPSSISLKGLYRDLGNTVGGTRNVYNNGVMCTKFYAGFSYDADEGDISTVQDVINWLQNNASLRTCSSNHMDNGVPSDYGWISFGNSDPNDGKFVFDTQVVVPANNENWNQVPGDAVWHYEYFLQPTKGNMTPVNVYLKFDYTDAQGETKTVSTLSSVLLTLNPDTWNNEACFYLYKDETNNVGAVRYNSESTPYYNESIHYILGWDGEPYNMTVSPSADQYESTSNYEAAYELPCNCTADQSEEFAYNRTFYVVACDYNKNSVVALIDNRSPGMAFTGGHDNIDVYGFQSQKVGIGVYSIVSRIICYSMIQKTISSTVQSGAAIAYWHDGSNIEQYSGDTTDDHLDVFEASVATISARALDSFGQRIDFSITFGDGAQVMSDWSLNSVSPVTD
ncbi:hypothetical protein [Enterobacter sp. 22452]|uniref:hypothetical protein n=1 Tax=Enterobacter TaxID=547 RepID=UPI003F87F5A3